MIAISFPQDLSAISSLIFIVVSILIIRRNKKDSKPFTDMTTLFFALGLVFFTGALAVIIHFFVKSEDEQDSIYAIIKWISFIGSILLLGTYIVKYHWRNRSKS